MIDRLPRAERAMRMLRIPGPTLLEDTAGGIAAVGFDARASSPTIACTVGRITPFVDSLLDIDARHLQLAAFSVMRQALREDYPSAVEHFRLHPTFARRLEIADTHQLKSFCQGMQAAPTLQFTSGVLLASAIEAATSDQGLGASHAFDLPWQYRWMSAQHAILLHVNHGLRQDPYPTAEHWGLSVPEADALSQLHDGQILTLAEFVGPRSLLMPKMTIAMQIALDLQFADEPDQDMATLTALHQLSVIRPQR